MKNLIRYKNRIYRKYSTDLWGQVIMKGKVTRMFKFLMQVFHLKLKMHYFKKGFTKNNSRKKKFIQYYKDDIASKINYLDDDLEKFKLDYNKNNQKNLKMLNEIETAVFKSYNENKNKNKFFPENKINFNFESIRVDNNMMNKDYFPSRDFPIFDSYFLQLKKWKLSFLNNIYKIYFLKNFVNVKKKNSLNNFLILGRRSTSTQFFRTKKLSRVIKIKKLEEFWKGRKKRTLLKLMDESFDNVNKLNSYTTWLDCERKFKAKKFTNWWKLRGAIRKISIFYGILSLKKFRYIENSINRKTTFKNFFVLKLETMINIILFRANLFYNIYFSNNFIRNGGILLNNKVIIYPFKFMKKGDILVINKKYFKKIFNIFFKKLFFSKKILKKNKKFSVYNKLNANKLLLNSPNYLEINYKILHIILWRLPYRSELKGISFSSTRSVYDWSIGTETDYQ